MKEFLSEDFLLETDSARQLYFNFASQMPIIDYHNHLPPNEIAEDKIFENITKIWLNGDHYKWRAMRTNGINEKYITGSATDEEKFLKWAETVPYTMRNPLYHWTHLELKNPFGIFELLNEKNAKNIYHLTSEKLKNLSTHKLLLHFKVELLSTTDDPIDNLEHHQKIKNENFSTAVLPTFRPDKAMAVEDVASFNSYLKKLAEVSNIEIKNLNSFILAIQKRHDFFHENGCRISDHGLENIYAEDYTENEIKNIFSKILYFKNLNVKEILKFKSAMLIEFAKMDNQKSWTQQFHIGALRNNNFRMQKKIGVDSGFDSIGDFNIAANLSRFLNKLDSNNELAKTIIYNLDPSQNEIFATMIGNFNDGSIVGKVQYGSAWWFNDQKDGMEKQLNVLSNMSLLSRFVGMVTDSRSFLSFPRHEYFRRILCNLMGNDIEKGLLPNDINWLGKMVENICYYNAKEYFKF